MFPAVHRRCARPVHRCAAQRSLAAARHAAALATCAEKLRLEMSLQPAASPAREQHSAALQQLQDLTEETMDGLAARLTSQFLPACTMSTDEVGAALNSDDSTVVLFSLFGLCRTVEVDSVAVHHKPASFRRVIADCILAALVLRPLSRLVGTTPPQLPTIGTFWTKEASRQS
jgi:hypothetical protein